MNKIKQFFLRIGFGIKCVFWSLIFKAKHRCGFLDLGKDVEIIGIITDTNVDTGNMDDDACFNVLPDPGYEWLLYYKDRKTADTLHCEFMPCQQQEPLLSLLKDVAKRFRNGEKFRVRIWGRHGLDGVHTGSSEFVEILKCIWGHGPNEVTGFCEIHPAMGLEVLGN